MSGTLFQTAAGVYGVAMVLQAAVLFAGNKAWSETGEMASSWLTRLAWLGHGAGLVMIWMASGWMSPPWVGQYHALVFAAWVAVGAFLILELRHGTRGPGTIVLGLAVAALLVAVLTPGKSVEPLTPMFRSRWILVHAAFGFLAHAFVILSAAISFFYLLKDRVRSEAIQLGFAALALALLPILGGRKVFTEAKLEFLQVIRDLDGGLLPVNFRMENGEMSAQYVAVPGGGWLLISVLAVFLLHLVFASVYLTGAPAQGTSKERESGTKRALLWLFALGTSLSIGLAGLLLYSNFRLAGFQIFSNPYRFAGFALLAAAAALVLCASIWSERAQEALPEGQTLDRLAYQSMATGFGYLTLTLLTGSIWAYFAWGRYWGWDPKEIWTLAAWLAAAIYLHQRAFSGYGSAGTRTASVTAILGAMIAIFAFLGVNLLLPGMHVFSF